MKVTLSSEKKVNIDIEPSKPAVVDEISNELIAVIDTETNYDDEVISIGIVVADSVTYQPLGKLYHIITPEYLKPSMFGSVLDHSRARAKVVLKRRESLDYIVEALLRNGIRKLFAYNANFDRKHLPELAAFDWYDIMRIAAYRQYNCSIPDCIECCKTGRMKSDYGAQSIYRMLSGSRRYNEVHNALTDAIDELEIMRMLGHDLSVYEAARLK